MNVLDLKKLRDRWKKRKPGDFTVLILIGVLLLIIALPTEKKTGKGTDNAQKREETQQEEMQQEETRASMAERNYAQEVGQQLTKILEQMEGVGKVNVMVTLKDDGLTVLDKDKKESEKEKEEKTVVYAQEKNTAPYVTSRQKPKIEGVFVVAQGGGNARVNSDISEAIMALFDVDAHKIKIVKMSEQED